MSNLPPFPNTATVSAWFNLGQSLREDGRLSEATACQHRVLAGSPGNSGAYIELSRVEIQRGILEAAKNLIQTALSSAGRNLTNQIAAGHLLARLGEIQSAAHTYRAAIRAAPQQVEAWEGLAFLLRGDLTPAECEAIVALLEKPAGLTTHERARLHYSLVEYHSATGNIDATIEHAQLANKLQTDDWVAQGRGHDVAAHSRLAQNIIDKYDQNYFASRAGWGEPSTRPVFIVGMPRSGTSLVEHILASHPHVFGAGELIHIGRGLEALGQGHPHPDIARAASAEVVRATAKEYLYRLSEINLDAPRVTDKLPFNYLNLGWIHTLFPNATVIHCERDPRDVALSCWLTGLANVRWSGDLEAITRYYRDYKRVMQHFERVLPNRVRTVRYEALVSDFEACAQQLFRDCGLAWEPGCLDFHRSDRAVFTASNQQVRKPIYRASVGKWEQFESVLAPYVESLMDPSPAKPTDLASNTQRIQINVGPRAVAPSAVG